MSRRPSSPPKPRLDELQHCRHFGTCGGCSLLDQPIQWQLHDKAAACEALLAPFLNGQSVAFAESDWTPRHFRTKLLYPVRADSDGLPIIGIYAFRSHELVRIEECRTQDTWLTAFGRAAEGALRQLRLQPFYVGDGADKGRGVVKALWARLASGTGQVLAGVVTRPGTFPQGPQLATALYEISKQIPIVKKKRQLVGFVHSISERDDEFLLGDRHVPLRGADHIVDRRDDLTFRISAGSFYQVHAEANELLYRPALAMCGDVRGKNVVDGYGGVGAFGLRLARAGAAHVTIIEESAAACRDAEHNAAVNGLSNISVVHTSFAGAKLPAKADLLVVDPPRAGLQKGVARIVGARPQRVLYVSCAAETLASDLAGLTKGGYRVTAVRMCDMFPHTEHVELVAMLERA